MDAETMQYFQQLFDSLKAEMATKADFGDLRTETAAVRQTVRENTEAILSYKAHIEKLLTSITRGQLSLEDQFDGMKLQLQALTLRVAELEKRTSAG